MPLALWIGAERRRERSPPFSRDWPPPLAKCPSGEPFVSLSVEAESAFRIRSRSRGDADVGCRVFLAVSQETLQPELAGVAQAAPLTQRGRVVAPHPIPIVDSQR